MPQPQAIASEELVSHATPGLLAECGRILSKNCLGLSAIGAVGEQPEFMDEQESLYHHANVQ